MRWISAAIVALVLGFAYWVEPDTVRIVEDGSTRQLLGRVAALALPSTGTVAPACMASIPINGGSQGIAVYTPCPLTVGTSSTLVTTAGTLK